MARAVAAINATSVDVLYSLTEIIAGLNESRQDIYRVVYFFKTVKNLMLGVPYQIAFGVFNSVCEYKWVSQQVCGTRE